MWNKKLEFPSEKRRVRSFIRPTPNNNNTTPRHNTTSLHHNQMEDRLVISAYRHLYKRGLQAIKHATPARHVLRNILRSSFRSENRSEFYPAKVARTLEFLDRAAGSNSYEHKMRAKLATDFYSSGRRDHVQNYLRLSKAAHFNSTLMLLNESLGTCLR